MFGDGMQKNELPLIIVCDDKDMVYANYLIQLIGQKDDAGDSIVGVEDDSVSAAIYTVKNYKDNLPQIPCVPSTIIGSLTTRSTSFLLGRQALPRNRAKQFQMRSISWECTMAGLVSGLYCM